MRMIAATTALALCVGTADAMTITDNILPDAIVQDFSDGDDIPRQAQFGGPGDASAGGITVTWRSTNSSAVFSGFTDNYTLANNGFWIGDDADRDGFVGTNSETASMTFEFETLVAGVGGLINYAISQGEPDGNPPVLSIFNGSGALLDTFNLLPEAPINTPGQANAGEFRGFWRTQADIASFTLSGAFIVLDDLTFTETAFVPVPAALPLMLAGLAGLGLVARRRA